MIFINFKTYEGGSGEKAINLVKIIEEVATQTQIKIIPAVQVLDLRDVIKSTKLEVWVQKIDPITYGASTGGILPEEVLAAGASGTFLNHSENRIEDFATLEASVNRAREVGLKSLVFAKDIDELTRICSLKPDYVSYEPPELIGGEISVSSAKPEIISQAVNITKEVGIPLIVGAGIHSREDIKTSLSLGAAGFAVASAIVKSDNPRKVILDLTEGYK